MDAYGGRRRLVGRWQELIRPPKVSGLAFSPIQVARVTRGSSERTFSALGTQVAQSGNLGHSGGNLLPPRDCLRVCRVDRHWQSQWHTASRVGEYANPGHPAVIRIFS